jgi:hypothetical protein
VQQSARGSPEHVPRAATGWASAAARGSHEILLSPGSALGAASFRFNQALLGNSCQAQKICMCHIGYVTNDTVVHPETPEDLCLCKLQVVTGLVADVLDKG